MLNYIWVGLIVIAISSAIGTDIYREVNNSYQNGKELEATYLQTSNLREEATGKIQIQKDKFNEHYKTSTSSNLELPILISKEPNGIRKFTIDINNNSPEIWKEMSQGALNKEKLSGVISEMLLTETENIFIIKIKIENISYIKLKSVTNATFDYAATAVTLALGLIGIMALWLGIMKIAEEAGFLKILTTVVRPITKKLFPDIPHDHPAIAAIVMNISASMLGLNNAATPMGLKAMEELNKLNTKIGTATNSMCTFLVINTSGLTLIPATVLAIRAAMGSANPGIIIAPSIFGAICAATAGLIAVKILQRMKRFQISNNID
ncbi:MAG: hypothetical protein O3A55_02455 [Bacteroidetes bacterium]|nr:hypothetical protein [Bacteroidota bacterium]